jgi:hypothetical protein
MFLPNTTRRPAGASRSIEQQRLPKETGNGKESIDSVGLEPTQAPTRVCHLNCCVGIYHSGLCLGSFLGSEVVDATVLSLAPVSPVVWKPFPFTALQCNNRFPFSFLPHGSIHAAEYELQNEHESKYVVVKNK